MANDQNLPWFFMIKHLKNCKVTIHSLLDPNKRVVFYWKCFRVYSLVNWNIFIDKTQLVCLCLINYEW